MKIALAQMNPIVGDLAGNCEKIESFCRQAAKSGSDFVATPELSLIGYPPRDLLAFENLAKVQPQFLDHIEKLSDELKIGISVGFAEKKSGPGKPFFNSVAVYDSGKKLGIIRKRRNPSYDIFEEDRFFDSDVSPQPLSKISFRDKFLHFFICEDLWTSICAHGIRDIRNYSKASSPIQPNHEPFESNSIGIFVSASPFWVGKRQTRLDLVSAISRRHKLPLCFVNQVGANDDIIFDGGSFVMNANGELKVPPAGFEPQLICFDGNESFQKTDSTPDSYWAELEQGIQLGIRDYFQKNNQKKALVGISGGVDSALVAVLAARALGPQNLDLVYLPSKNNEQTSFKISKEIAANLNCNLRVINIDNWVSDFTSKLELKTGSLAYENLQSRLRGLCLMEISNNENRLLLATGNKAELALGYSTLYGDMCGALMPIGDLYKTEVYGLSFYLNQVIFELGNPAPIPMACLLRPPSAELSPNQTDQQTLPPYEILDAYLFELIENQGSLRDGAESWDEILKKFGHSRSQLNKKFFASEFKRNQAPPILKLHQRSFGFGWRLPLTQGFKV